MSESFLKNKQAVLMRFFEYVSSDKSIIKMNDFDDLEKLVSSNKEFKDFEKSIVEMINDIVYFAIQKLDIKISGIDETQINKIALNKAKYSNEDKKKENHNYNTYTKLYQQSQIIEKIKLLEIKKYNRNYLKNSKNSTFEISKDMLVNYFCENIKDIILVEKLMLIVDQNSKFNKLHTIIKKEFNKEKSRKNDNNITKEKNRGRTRQKEVKNIEIDLTNESKSKNSKRDNSNNDDKNNINIMNCDKKNISASNTKTSITCKKQSLSNDEVLASNNNKKKKRKERYSPSKSKSPENNNNDKTKNKKKRAVKNQDISVERKDLSCDKSCISDENIEKNKINFFNALKNMTKNMLIESKIKGENIEYIVEPEIIPDLEQILANPTSRTQIRTKEKSNLVDHNSLEDYDYNNISDYSNLKTNLQKKSSVGDNLTSHRDFKSNRSNSKRMKILNCQSKDHNKSIELNMTQKNFNEQDQSSNKNAYAEVPKVVKFNEIDNLNTNNKINENNNSLNKIHDQQVTLTATFNDKHNNQKNKKKSSGCKCSIF